MNFSSYLEPSFQVLRDLVGSISFFGGGILSFRYFYLPRCCGLQGDGHIHRVAGRFRGTFVNRALIFLFPFSVRLVPQFLFGVISFTVVFDEMSIMEGRAPSSKSIAKSGVFAFPASLPFPSRKLVALIHSSWAYHLFWLFFQFLERNNPWNNFLSKSKNSVDLYHFTRIFSILRGLNIHWKNLELWVLITALSFNFAVSSD